MRRLLTYDCGHEHEVDRQASDYLIAGTPVGTGDKRGWWCGPCRADKLAVACVDVLDDGSRVTRWDDRPRPEPEHPSLRLTLFAWRDYPASAWNFRWAVDVGEVRFSAGLGPKDDVYSVVEEGGGLRRLVWVPGEAQDRRSP